MNTRIIALFAGLLAVLPMTSAWAGGGGSSTTYYAALKASVSNTGGGKVYAGTGKSAGTYNTPASTSANQSSTTQDEGKTFYAFAQADSGYEFAGWSTSDGGTVSSTDNPYAVTVKCSSSTEGSPTTTTVWANFKKKVLALFGITFETSDAGTYTVDGVAPVNKTGLTEATTVKLASSDPSFLNWRVNGAVVNGNPYDLTCVAATTVSAEFLTADQVAEATTFAELTAALANDGKRKITIPAGVDITIAKGATVTVPAGKQLVVNGGLLVVGTLANSGAISGSGTIYKISYLIEQGEIKKPLQVTGEEWGNMAMTGHGYKPYYRVTTTTANTPTVPSSISGCASSWAVLFKGKAVKISKQSPKALAVTRDTADSASTIKSIADNADTDEIKGNSDHVLLQDCTISGPLDGSSRVSSQKAYDCAGHKATISASKIAGSNMLFMNGVVALTPSSENQNSIATFINCSSMTINKIKNGSPKYYFYDCGSAGAMASLSFAFYGGSSNTTNFRQAYFYSGYYSYIFSDAADAKDSGGHSYVYNGSFSSNPSAYLQQSASPNGLKVEGSKSPYKVVENVAAVNCVQVGGTQYASLAEAVSAVSSGGTLSLILPVTLTEKLVIPSGKQITIDLNGVNLSGGSIENSGALRFEDNSGAAQPGTLSTPVVGKAGTIDITFGSYAGTFTMEGGVLTTHNGTFASTFSATEAGGRVSLRGGCFAGTVAVPADCRQRSGYIGQKVVGYIGDAGKIGDADVSYLVTGFSPNDDLGLGASDESLYLNFMKSKSGWASRSDFVGREALWDRLAELRSVGEPIKGQAFEASISFDRAVGSGTVSGWAKILGSSKEMAMDQDLDPEEDYNILIPLVTGAGYTAKSFKHMFDGEDNGVWEQVHCGVENKSLANIGTTVTVKFQIRMGGQKAGYTFETERSRSYKFAGNGAIAGNTDYTTLKAALKAANYSGTVRLSKDCSESIVVGQVCEFTIDANNFDFTGSIGAADGFAISDDGNGKYAVTVVQPPQPPVAKIGEVEYTDVFEAMARVKGGETLVLVADCTADFALDGWMLDTNGFAVDGSISVADGANYWLKQTGNVYSAASWAAEIGAAKYSSLANAVNAAKWQVGANATVTVVMLQDSNENVALPEGVIVDTNGHAFGGSWSLPAGYAAVIEGSTVRAEIGYAAVIGTVKYDTLKEAVAAAADGDAIRVVKDCSTEGEIVIAREITVNAGAFVDDGQLKADVANGFAISVENGIYKVVNARVAQIGDDYYTSLEDAIDAVADAPAVITLLKSCDEVVVVGKACTFEIVAGDHEFTGDILAVDGYAVSVSAGGVWTVAKVESVVLDEEIVVKVGEGLVSAVTEEVVTETGTTDAEAVQAKLIEKIAAAEVVGTGLAKVSVEDGKKTIVKAIDAQEVTQQETGLYQATTLKNVDNVETVPVLNKEAEMKAVVSDTTKEKSLILAIPGETTVAAAIASEPADGDTIAYYGEGGAEHMWVRVKGNWVASGASGEAESFTLPAGAAIRYVRSDGNDKPVTVVTPYKSEDEVKVEIKEEGWNVVANPNVGEPFDLNKITPTTAKVTSQELEKDKIVVPMGGQSERVYTYKNGQWGYASTEKVPLANGMTMLKKVHKTDDSKVAGGKGFWFFSSEESTKPTIQWRAGAAK